MILAKVVSVTSVLLSLFEPLSELTETSGVALEEGALETSQGSCVTLMVKTQD